MAKKTKNTEQNDTAAQAKAALQALATARETVETVKARHAEELAEVQSGVSDAIELLHTAVGGAWVEIDGKLMQPKRNKYGFYLREFQPQERPEAALSL